MVPISICIIAKNEEKNLHPFLSSIKEHMKNYPHEVIFVDTGSTDDTVKIATEYLGKTYHFDWIGDFSAARNYSISLAKYDWILVLDCDEYITKFDYRCIEQLTKEYPQGVGVLTRNSHYEMNETDSIYTDQVERLFNKKYYHYESIIHEQVRHKTRGSDYTRVAFPLYVDHCGYVGTPEEIVRKAERNNELLFKMLEETPDDPYLYFQIGQSYNMIHDDEKAAYYYGKGLEFDVNPEAEYVRMMVVSYGYNLLHLNRLEEALAFQAIYDDFGDRADFVCLMGLIYMHNGMLLQAMGEFLKAISFEEANVLGVNSFIPYYNMGVINEITGDAETAKQYYKKCGDFKPAMDRLNELN